MYVDSADSSAATTDVITVTREPSSSSVVESSTHLRHVTSAPPAFAGPDTITTSASAATLHYSQPNFTFISPSTVTSQHGGLKPKPETECDSNEKKKSELIRCQTLRNDSLHDVS